MNKNPIVSVVVPAYNEEGCVKDCVETLLRQSYKPLEIIFVDDGSSDKTMEILNGYNIKILKQDHKGPGKARNLGVKNSKGEILIFVDADMKFHKDFIKNLIKPILNGKAIGTNYQEEIVSNMDNVWARLWGRRITTYKGKFAIFRAILKSEFLKTKGFDSSLGYADDQNIAMELGKRPVLAKNVIVYHKNPDTLKEVYLQSRWIGGSYDSVLVRLPLLKYFLSPFLYLVIPFKITANLFKVKEKRLMLYYPIFGFFKYLGFVNGVMKKICLKRNAK
jgi:glycosyltransferase involved in cell wall biosynthesis